MKTDRYTPAIDGTLLEHYPDDYRAFLARYPAYIRPYMVMLPKCPVIPLVPNPVISYFGPGQVAPSPDARQRRKRRKAAFLRANSGRLR